MKRPVEQVSWEDCQEFLTKLSQQDGKLYILPSEAEWEYACRSGTTTPFHFGEALSTDKANYYGEYPYNGGKRGRNRRQTMPVGCFPPNAWGLFDMHGNVREWCQDEYRDYKELNTKNILETQIMDNIVRVLRGGSRENVARHCRAAHRYRLAPSIRHADFGFRVAFRLD